MYVSPRVRSGEGFSFDVCFFFVEISERYTRVVSVLDSGAGLLPIRCLVNRGTMGVNSLPETVTGQRRGCDLNPGPSAPESSALTTRLPSHPPFL